MRSLILVPLLQRFSLPKNKTPTCSRFVFLWKHGNNDLNKILSTRSQIQHWSIASHSLLDWWFGPIVSRLATNTDCSFAQASRVMCRELNGFIVKNKITNIFAELFEMYYSKANKTKNNINRSVNKVFELWPLSCW